MKELEKKLDLLSEQLKRLQENEQNELYDIVVAQNELLSAQNELLSAQNERIENLSLQISHLGAKLAELIELLADSNSSAV